MKSAPIVIVVILIALAGAWFFLSRVEKQSGAQTEPVQVKNMDVLEDTTELAVIEREVNFIDGRKEFFVEPFDDAPEGEKFPGVVMIHEWWGLNENIKEMARGLAGHGYKVLAVDLYKGKIATTTPDAIKYRADTSLEETTRILREAVRFLREQNSDKVASLGWGYGGEKSLELALSGEPLDATVIYYGQLVTEPQRLSLIKWPVLGIFGDEDKTIPVETVETFENVLNSAGITNEIYRYPGVGHALANPSRGNYAPDETKDAWAKTLAFLKKSLK